MPDNDNRIEILTDSEIHELYGVPQFTDAQRERYFDLDESLTGTKPRSCSFVSD